jgi:hypothetical protein
MSKDVYQSNFRIVLNFIAFFYRSSRKFSSTKMRLFLLSAASNKKIFVEIHYINDFNEKNCFKLKQIFVETLTRHK